MIGLKGRVAERWEGTLVFSMSPSPAQPDVVDEWEGVVRDLLEFAVGGRPCTLVTFPHDAPKKSFAWSLPGTFAVKNGEVVKKRKRALWVTPVRDVTSALLTEIAECLEFGLDMTSIVIGLPAPEDVAHAVDAVTAADRRGERPQTELEVIAPMNDHEELWWVNARQDPAGVAAALSAHSSIPWHTDDGDR